MSTGKAVHILGLLSPGGVHSRRTHPCHGRAGGETRGAKTALLLHAFLDGRDTPPRSAAASIKATEDKFMALGRGRIASGSSAATTPWTASTAGRASRRPMTPLTQGKAEYTAKSASEGLKWRTHAMKAMNSSPPPRSCRTGKSQCRGRRMRRERRPPGATGSPISILDGDVVVFMNFRSDRARQITRPFIEENFDGFQRAWPAAPRTLRESHRVSVGVSTSCAHSRRNACAMCSARIWPRTASTSCASPKPRYAHVTFFSNGGEEAPVQFEDRILVPSPTDVPTYNSEAGDERAAGDRKIRSRRSAAACTTSSSATSPMPTWSGTPAISMPRSRPSRSWTAA